MNGDDVTRAVRRVVARRPDLALAVQVVADALTAGEGAETIHQASLQEYLWWYMPRDVPDDEWQGLVDAAALLLDELGLAHLAGVARAAQTQTVLAAWRESRDKGAAAFRSAHARSGVEPPDTARISWGSIMGVYEAGALDAVERALGEAVATGELVPGAPRWQAKAATITEAVLTRPLDLPPGQTLAGLIVTERIGTWIDSARHRHSVHAQWRSAVANRLLHPVDPPGDSEAAVAPMHWLLARAAEPGGTELTQSHNLARATVLAAVERFGWWDWEKPPRSEADVFELQILRAAASRLRLVRRRGRQLHTTAKGAALVKDPDRLWAQIAAETEDGEPFTRAVTELVGLRLLRGRVDTSELDAEIAPILSSQGWATSAGPITVRDASFALWRPLRWWRIFGALDEVEATWEYGTARQLTPHTIALTTDGERMVLAYLRAEAAGPRRGFGV